MCMFLIPPTSCTYLLLLFLAHITTFHKTIHIHYCPQHGFAKEEKGKIIDKVGVCVMTVLFFSKVFSNRESKGKVKQR